MGLNSQKKQALANRKKNEQDKAHRKISPDKKPMQKIRIGFFYV